ncbi:MAG: benzoyl-CoA 2,3-epoxidase subunit BoxA [Burkholderiaceae bacterium]|nr:benzoyl-CoA 2,3-epoxidase subunit BoxA [Burkholderiaceae bacterium]
MSLLMPHILTQHLIDPAVCIRCNSCEEACPQGAIVHDENNYVVDAARCNHCKACVAPCPTGAIDQWHAVEQPYTLEEQFGWDDLPAVAPLSAAQADGCTAVPDTLPAVSETVAPAVIAPLSAAKPVVHLYGRAHPVTATLLSNKRATQAGADNDVRHIVLDFGAHPMPVLEGQSIGIIPPGLDERGRAHIERLYSVASPRNGERPGTNTVALTVKRESHGLCSNYLCDLLPGQTVQVVGPFGTTFLMPEDPQSHLIMVCTGTGVAPFRGFIEHRLRSMRHASGELLVFFGGRRPEELPYFGQQENLPEGFLEHYLCFSRDPGQPRMYVQDHIRNSAGRLRSLLLDPKTHVYICGLKGMEVGVEDAFADILQGAEGAWAAQRETMSATGRYHVETY